MNQSLQEEFDVLTHIRFDPEENVHLEDKSTLSSAYFEEIESMYHFTPDLSIQCPDKQRLYKKTAAPVLPMLRYIAVAAATVVTAGIIWWMKADTIIQPSIVQVVPMQQEPKNSVSTAPIAVRSKYTTPSTSGKLPPCQAPIISRPLMSKFG